MELDSSIDQLLATRFPEDEPGAAAIVVRLSGATGERIKFSFELVT